MPHTDHATGTSATTAPIPGPALADGATPAAVAITPLVTSQPRPEGGRVLADVGGTHARFAWQAGPGQPLVATQVLASAEHPSVQAATEAYVAWVVAQGLARPTAMAMAIACPVTGDAVRMTNHHWAFSQSGLRAALGLQRLCVLNDFQALALALPTLPEAELCQVGGGVPQPGSAKALLGAGTGLGVSGLVPVSGAGAGAGAGAAGATGAPAWVPLAGEGGHVTLPATTPQERWLVDRLAQRHGHVSAERVLCGQGLWDTYALLCEAAAAPVACADAAAVSTAALAGTDPQAHAALSLWCGLLGSVAGNLALTLGALGGVYVGGGIVPRLGGWFGASPFRARFEDKGRYRAYLQAIPVWVITSAQSPALHGAACALDAGGSWAP